MGGVEAVSGGPAAGPVSEVAGDTVAPSDADHRRQEPDPAAEGVTDGTYDGGAGASTRCRPDLLDGVLEMTTFVVTYTHPDEEGWHAHVGAHVDWLVGQVEVGGLRASGPLVGTAVRSAMLVIDAADRDALDRLIATDPFAVEGLIADMTVTEWDPVFGELGKRASS